MATKGNYQKNKYMYIIFEPDEVHSRGSYGEKRIVRVSQNELACLFFLIFSMFSASLAGSSASTRSSALNPEGLCASVSIKLQMLGHSLNI